MSAEQKAVIDRAVETMSEPEVNRNLETLKLPLSGPFFERRERLKAALGIVAVPSIPKDITPSRIEIENASEGEYFQGEDDKRGLLILRGRIRIRTGSGVFHANIVIVDGDRKEIYAEGDVVFSGPGTEIRAERMLFDQRLGTGIMYNADGYKKPVYFVGRHIKLLGEKKFAASHVHFTTCAARRPHTNFTARRVYVYENEKIVAVGVIYWIGGVPILPLPFLYASDWGTGIISQAGWGQIQGAFLQNTYQFSVPTAMLSSWQPVSYRFKLDTYERTGESAGVDMMRFSPGLNYVLQLGASQFQNYEAEIRGTKVRTTNNVQHYIKRPDDSITPYGRGNEYYQWQKAYGVVNWKNQSLEDNVVRNVHIKYEDYTNRRYDYEFGGRYQPTSTIPALYQNHEAGRGLIHNDTNWNLVWNEMRDDLTIRVEASRTRVWLEKQRIQDGEYVPVVDVVPSVDISKKMLLGNIPGIDAPVYWDNILHSDLRKEYSSGEIIRNLSTNRFTSSFRSYFSPIAYVTFSPVVGGGGQKVMPTGKDPAQADLAAIDREAKKQSYEFAFTEDELTLGPEFAFLRATYRRKDSAREEAADAPQINIHGFYNAQKIHETEVNLETHFLHAVNMSVTGIYDHRKFEYPVENRERWYYPVFRTDVYLDFVNMFRADRENLLSRQKAHFLGLRLTNDYVYDPIKKRDHSDVLGLNFQAGGFDLWLLRRLRYLEVGAYWYHVYYNPELDHMRYTMRGDIQLTRRIYWEFELESRASDVERYRRRSKDDSGNSDYVAFEHDVVNGTGVNGPEKRQKAVFNVGYFETALIFDLHEWEYRIGYSMEQKSLLTAGSGSLSVVNFYDNKIFFSIQLLRFDIGGVGDRPSRFILDRQRVRSGDVGRTQIRSERTR